MLMYSATKLMSLRGASAPSTSAAALAAAAEAARTARQLARTTAVAGRVVHHALATHNDRCRWARAVLCAPATLPVGRLVAVAPAALAVLRPAERRAALDAVAQALLASVLTPVRAASLGPWLGDPRGCRFRLAQLRLLLTLAWTDALAAPPTSAALSPTLRLVVLAGRPDAYAAAAVATAAVQALWAPVWAVPARWAELHAALTQTQVGVHRAACLSLALAAMDAGQVAAAVAVLTVPLAATDLQPEQLRRWLASTGWATYLRVTAAGEAVPPGPPHAPLHVLGNVVALLAPLLASDHGAATALAVWAQLVRQAAAPRAGVEDSSPPSATRYHPLWGWARVADGVGAVPAAPPGVVAQVQRLWASDMVRAVLLGPSAAATLAAAAELYTALLEAFPAVERDVQSAVAFAPGVVPALWQALASSGHLAQPMVLAPLADRDHAALLQLYAATVGHLYQYVHHRHRRCRCPL
jgi:hypothetical protein